MAKITLDEIDASTLARFQAIYAICGEGRQLVWDRGLSSASTPGYAAVEVPSLDEGDIVRLRNKIGSVGGWGGLMR